MVISPERFKFCVRGKWMVIQMVAFVINIFNSKCATVFFIPSRFGRGNKGFSLVEVLVSLVIVSLGLLGLAAMQLKGLQSAHLSYQRTLATVAAQDAVERLWVRLWEAQDSCPSPESVESDWLLAWKVNLPGMESRSSISAIPECGFEVVVEWLDERFSNEDSSSKLVYVARLPQKP